MPFDGSNFKRLVKQITTGDYYEPKHPSREIIYKSCKILKHIFISYIIAAASPLIRGMLTVSAEKRATISEICAHPWINEVSK